MRDTCHAVVNTNDQAVDNNNRHVRMSGLLEPRVIS